MAGLTSQSRQQFSTIAWLRWRIFINSFRKKGARGELVARAIFFPVVAIFWLAPTVGAGIAGYYLVAHDLMRFLPVPLWAVFVIWQITGINTSSTAPTFDLSSLIRFPIRYRDYLLVRLSFGLLDMPTVVGGCCLVALTIGIGVADVGLLPVAAVALFLYGLCNILFSRMVYSWLERWMALRRTRELVGGLFILLSLGIQSIGPILRRFNGHGHHAPLDPRLEWAASLAVKAGRFLPPGAAASAITAAHGSRPWLATVGVAGVFLYGAVFLFVLNLRLHAQYRGENLSEAPAATRAKAGPKVRRTPAVSPATNAATSTTRTFASSGATVAACVVKEVHYLLRSGPLLYTLIVPAFMMLIIGSRSSSALSRGAGGSFLFAYGCAYLQIFMAALLYNCFGADGAGVQFYFLAPVRFRDVVMAKNIVNAGILVVEVAVIYLVGSLVLSARPSGGVTAMTIAWVLLSFLLSLIGGNLRSIYSPKKIGTANVRGQRVSGLSSLISFGVLLVPLALGGAAVFLLSYLDYSTTAFLATTGVFLVLTAIAFAVYLVVLLRLDELVSKIQQDFTAELSKA